MLYSSADRYEIHVKLVHINSRWIGTIVYRVTLNEMFVCSSLIHVCILQSCRDVWQMVYISQFMIVLHARNLIHSYALVRTRCFDNWSISRFRLRLHYFLWSTYALRCLSSKCSARGCLYWRRFLFDFIRSTIFSYWFQNAFRIQVLDQKLYHAGDVFFF